MIFALIFLANAALADCKQVALVKGQSLAYGDVYVSIRACEKQVIEVSYDHHPTRSVLISDEDSARLEQVLSRSMKDGLARCARATTSQDLRHGAWVQIGSEMSVFCAGGSEAVALRLRDLARDLYWQN